MKAITKGKKNFSKFYFLLFDTGIGLLMFGDEFAPLTPSINDKYNGNYNLDTLKIGMFLSGGDYKKIFSSLSDQKLIEGARIIEKYVS